MDKLMARLINFIRTCWRCGRFLRALGFLLALLLLARCNAAKTTQIPALDTSSPLMMTPINETPQPTIIPSSTIAETQKPTLTAVVSLPAEIMRKNLIDLFTTNGGCDFPCWWGISHGDDLQKISELAPVTGKSLHLYGNSLYSYTLSLDSLNLADFIAEFYVDSDQIVRSMEIRLEKPSRFKEYLNAFEEHLSLTSLLGRYGKPSEVLILVEPLGGPNVAREYALFLIYKAQGFGIEYTGKVDSENPIRICSSKLNDDHLEEILLYLQDPQLKITERNRFHLHEFKSIDKVTSMSLYDFYQVFSEPGSTECIETTIDHWE